MQTNNASYIITFDTIWIICGGLIRAITMLAIGTFVYRMTEIAKEKFDPEKGTTRLWITIAAFLCWIVSFWFFWTNQERSLEFAVVYFMIAGVFFSCLGMTYTNKILGNRFVNWLAKLSFPMFLNQSWVRKVFMLLPLKEAGLSYGVIMLLYVAAVIIVSIICMLVMDKIMDLIHKRKTQAATV